jgi:Phospholipid methyltransferase
VREVINAQRQRTRVVERDQAKDKSFGPGTPALIERRGAGSSATVPTTFDNFAVSRLKSHCMLLAMATDTSNASPPPGLWSGQVLHFACLAVLLVALSLAWTMIGKPFAIAFWTAVAFPIVHQVFVWLTWRFELQSSAISRTIGFAGYLAAFFTLFGARFVSLAALAWLDRGSLNLGPAAQVAITTLLALPGIYAMYSVQRYFGFARAAGADHFEKRYRKMPLVNEGIFRFTSNGMYVYAFFLFWAIAVGLNSMAALVVAAFSHAYIWVHYYATEKPDMDFLYASETAEQHRKGPAS